MIAVLLVAALIAVAVGVVVCDWRHTPPPDQQSLRTHGTAREALARAHSRIAADLVKEQQA